MFFLNSKSRLILEPVPSANAPDVLITSVRLAGDGGHRRFQVSIMLSRLSVSTPQPWCWVELGCSFFPN